MEASGSTLDHDRDSVVEVSSNDADPGDNESDSYSDSQESITNYGPESATGDCLKFTDTEEVAVISAQNKCCKKVQAPCSITKGCLWREGKWRQIADSCHTVWVSDYEVIKTEQDLALKEDCSSFEVNKMMVRTNKLLKIKEATHSKSTPVSLRQSSTGERRP